MNNIDLAQLDSLRNAINGALSEANRGTSGRLILERRNEELLREGQAVIEAARRSLTIGSHADAIRAKCVEVLQSWDEQGTDRCLIASAFRQKLDELATLTAAPIQAASGAPAGMTPV